jgi:hypothetical protein
MTVRKRMPRMTLEEWRALARSARQLQACAETLTRSTWQGAPAVLGHLSQVHEVIAGLYNRAEPAAVQSSEEGPSEMPQEASEEGSSSVSPSEAPTAAAAKEEA